MVTNFHIPPTGFGPGSQPGEEDGKELEYMKLPENMRSYTMHIPENTEDADLTPALSLLGDIADASDRVAADGGTETFDLSGLDKANRALIAETMGEGEVAMKLFGRPALAVQESVFAGVWVLHAADVDAIEVGRAPAALLERAFEPRTPGKGPKAPLTPGVVNAPPLAVELYDKSANWSEDKEAHVINLTLLPHTEEDLLWLDVAIGQGSADVLSRGYGNCRVNATALPHVWRVQFFNSMDTLILDTFEVTLLPEVALAADEDLRDSAERLREVREAIE